MLLPDFTAEIGLICLIISVIACVKAILNGKSVELKKIHLTSPKIERRHNLIFISDIHLGSNSKRHLETICDKIHGLNYEHLLIGGDLFDSSAFDAEDLVLFKTMKGSIFFVTGNHEYYVKDHAKKVANLTKYNITISGQPVSPA